jgi:serine/threonine protein kinase
MQPQPEDDPTLSIGAAAQPGQHTFSSGDLLAERFCIVRFIGRGGMGEVYEADDLELYERVALKTIRREVASCEGMLARFRNEIQLARKVTHPNVCRIFDLARHGEISFLTMELLDGESLASRRDWPRPTERAACTVTLRPAT